MSDFRHPEIMRSGKLRHRVNLQEATETRDSYGGVTKAWANIATLWASIEPLGGREYLLARQTNATTSHKITLRHRSGVTSKMRIKHGDRYFNIGSVTNTEERDRETVLLCTEVV